MERRAIAVWGTVQGVGFRPYVFGLAQSLDLHGFVRNQGGGVQIEIEGEPDHLDQFLDQLKRQPLPLARVDDMSWQPVRTRGDGSFRIESSHDDAAGPIVIPSDAATCDQCLAELFDPRDRRYRYPFLNCTNCGPRLTIITGSPYDRERTTMAGFAMCPACRAEYEDPTNRRFHAQPTACSVCGPRLNACDAHGRPAGAGDPIDQTLAALRAGRIVAIKGLGRLSPGVRCPAGSRRRQLRRRKHRDEKPFAIMVRDVAMAAQLCHLNSSEEQLLSSSRRPIVLLKWRKPSIVAQAVAPGNPCLGVMLPYAPVHFLLTRDPGGAPLVMTSGNQSDEPIAHQDDDALARLAAIADLFLTHDRPIRVRCDDSVTRVVAGQESPVRRSRGYTPQPITLAIACPKPILAVGGQLKATFALGRDRHAVMSHHLGDLDHYQAYLAFERDVLLYQQLFAIEPQCIVHDVHPDYATTRYARQRAQASSIPCLEVQHHHAHMASCMAEHGLTGPVVGVTFDGTGTGTDGAVWGGEFLVGDYQGFERAAHLRYVGMPGGEQAVRQPWRMALAHLVDAQSGPVLLERRIPADSLRAAMQMIESRFNTPMTSSAGRLFDAVAAMVDVRDRVSYEGQAAMELEWLATGAAVNGVYPFELGEGLLGEGMLGGVVDTRPIIRAVARDVEQGLGPSRIARRFHSTMVEIIAAVCARIRQARGLDTVVLSGGVFMNALLTAEVEQRLRDDGWRVYRHRLVPTNDGGLSLGQLAIAAAQMSSEPLENSGRSLPEGLASV